MSKASIILGSPREDSYGTKLTLHYAEELKRMGVAVTIYDIKNIDFDWNLPNGYNSVLEPEIVRIQEEIAQSDLLVFSYPMYWNSYPALFKAFIDKVLWVETAFSMKNKKFLWNGLFRGKKARILYTLGGSSMESRILAGSGGVGALKGGLRLTGIFSTKVTAIQNLNSHKRKSEDEHLQLINKAAKQDVKRLASINN